MSRVDEWIRNNVAAETPAKKKKREWKAVLGQILEYGDSGFSIVLIKAPRANQAPYQLRDPEGRVLGDGDNLAQMKRYVEEQAAYRDEFEPSTPTVDLLAYR